MTVSSIGPGSSRAFDQADVFDGSSTSVACEIAVLALETQENQKQSDRQQLSLARAEFSEALDDEVEALKAEADAGFRGAMLEAGLTVVGAGMSVWGAARGVKEPTWQGKSGDGLDHLAKPLGAVVGKNYGAANAKSAEGVETAAKWQLDDARKGLDDANSAQSKALDWLGSTVDRDAATMSVILSNKV